MNDVSRPDINPALRVAPKVSIVMPCCNMANFIRDSLESLARQTLQDYELLCIDDGSTDETPEIIRVCGQRQSHNARLPEKHGGVRGTQQGAVERPG